MSLYDYELIHVQCADGNMDMESIRVASEMCLTMFMNVETEVEAMFDEWRSGKEVCHDV